MAERIERDLERKLVGRKVTWMNVGLDIDEAVEQEGLEVACFSEYEHSYDNTEVVKALTTDGRIIAVTVEWEEWREHGRITDVFVSDPIKPEEYPTPEEFPCWREVMTIASIRKR